MKIVLQRIITVFILICSGFAYAGPGDGPPPPGVPPPELPINNGILMLALAALSYGLYKIMDFRKNKKTPV